MIHLIRRSFLVFGFGISAVAAAQQRPNIVWISCEDLSPHFEFYGDSTVATPHLSRLAREGIVYEKVFTTAGVCAPSRLAIITGMNQVSSGGHNMRTLQHTFPEKTGLPESYSIVPPPDVKAFPEFMRARGYYCTNNSKTDYQFIAPVTVWDESSPKATWRNRKPGQPFFAVVNFMVTHESQVWMRKDHPLHVAPTSVPVPPVYPYTKTVRQDLARHYSNIVDLDSLVGIVLAQLEEDKLLENTFVFFWSDHGDGLPFFKRELYDRGLHIPLVVRFPGRVHAGERNRDLISAIDLAPTVLSLAGIPPPAYMQGKAFLGKYKSKTPNAYVFAARDRMDTEYDRVRAVRDQRFKYIRNFQPHLPRYQNIAFRLQQDMMREMLACRESGELDSIQAQLFANTKSPEELYDLESDPFELVNLANHTMYQADLIRLRNVLDDWLITSRDKGGIPEKELIRQMWGGNEQPPRTVSVRFSRQKGNLVALSTETEGASIAYRISNPQKVDGVWKVYTEPVFLKKGETLHALAHRIGYEPSEEAMYTHK